MVVLPEGVERLAPEDPEAIGGYRLLGRLGVGGMGVVYLAGEPGRYVAVKVMRSADLHDPAARTRFAAEAEIARRLNSAHTPGVIEDGSSAPVPYLVTEYISGPSLREVVRTRGPLEKDALYAVAIGVADALADVHAAGIVHRDVKPGNVLLSPQGPRLIDFGIAQPVDWDGGLTQTGQVMGSPGWVAPERLTGAPATAASDVFGWGLLAAYAATGRHPFGTGEAIQLAERIVALSPDLSELDEPLHALVQAALSKEPSARPNTDDIRQGLMRPLSEPTAALAVANLWGTRPMTRPQPRPRPRRALWLALLVGALIPIGTLVLLAAQDDENPPPPQPVKTVVTTVSGEPAPTRTQRSEGVPAPSVPSSPSAEPSSPDETTSPSPSSEPPEPSPSETEDSDEGNSMTQKPNPTRTEATTPDSTRTT